MTVALAAFSLDPVEDVQRDDIGPLSVA